MIGYIKQFLAALTAALAGYVLGVYTVATKVPKLNWVVDGPPTWFVATEAQYIVAAGGACVCALAWMYIDYKYVVNVDG